MRKGYSTWLLAGKGLEIFDPGRCILIRPVVGRVFYSGRNAWHLWKRRTVKRTMFILPMVVPLLIVLWLLPLFLYVGLRFNAAYFTAAGWFFSVTAALACRVWLKDKLFL